MHQKETTQSSVSGPPPPAMPPSRGRPPARLTPTQPLDLVCGALSHRARRAILDCLRHYGRLSGRGIARCFPQAKANALSAHLRVLRDAGLVTVEAGADMRGRVYRVTPAAGAELRQWLARMWPDELEASRARQLDFRGDIADVEEVSRLLRSMGPEGSNQRQSW
jgi:DNA-binding transcriptional ArsR family regulator